MMRVFSASVIKKHKKRGASPMRRTSRIYLNNLNPGKSTRLAGFLNSYVGILSYFIEGHWSLGDDTVLLAPKAITDRAVERFGVTARLAQCAAKQAKETIRSQRGRAVRTMPCVRQCTATLDSRFVLIAPFNGKGFDMCLRLKSGVPAITIPFNWTRHADKFRAKGWSLASSVRIGLNTGRLWVDLIFEKPCPPLRTNGLTVGADRGFKKAFVLSDGQVIGGDLSDVIKTLGKRAKTARYFIRTELFRRLKRMNLDGVKTLVLEDLRNIKRGKRGTFSRHMNRLLSFWLTARAVQWLECRCEELGVRIVYKSPYKTSQRCSHCGKIDRRNRRAERFKCVSCGVEDDADHNASKNLEFLGLAGVYSLRLLQT